jgi:hypothetical protein
MLAHKFSGKKNIFYVPLKGQISMLKYDYSQDILCLFYTSHIECSFITKNLCAKIKCPDIHTKFYFNFFYTLKLVFIHFS